MSLWVKCFYLWDSSSAAEPEDDESQCQNHEEGNPCNTIDKQHGEGPAKKQCRGTKMKIKARTIC